MTNTGKCEGADVPQLSLTDAPAEKRLRLLGFERVDAGKHQWRIAYGTYRVALGKSANDFVLTGGAPLTSRLFGR